jgi:GTP1/Obg family GTP-binding protein
MKKVVRVDPKFYEELVAAQKERDNLRKAYQEVNERGEMIRRTLQDEIRALQSRVETLTNTNKDLNAVKALAEQFAREKDEMSKALVKLTLRFEELIEKYHEVTRHKA